MNDLSYRATFAFVLGLTLAGCAVPGQRIDGDCPPGETCSSATDGLFFSGAQLSGDIFGTSGVPVTAVGGTQTVRVLTDAALDSDPYDAPFDAKSSDPGVFDVGELSPPTLQVHGEGEGKALLRLLEPKSDELLDRVELAVAPIARASLYPADLSFAVDTTKEPDAAVLAGSTTALTVRLEAEDGTRLVDEQLTLTPPSGELDRQAWDLFGAPIDASPGEMSFQVGAGGDVFPAKLTVVEEVDEVAPALLFGPTSDATMLTKDGVATLCFFARSSGIPTAGATWSYEGSAGIEVQLDGPDALDVPGCVNVRGAALGPATLEVTASGATATFQIEVVEASQRVRRRMATPRSRAATAGHRAHAAE